MLVQGWASATSWFAQGFCLARPLQTKTPSLRKAPVLRVLMLVQGWASATSWFAQGFCLARPLQTKTPSLRKAPVLRVLF